MDYNNFVTQIVSLLCVHVCVYVFYKKSNNNR